MQVSNGYGKEKGIKRERKLGERLREIEKAVKDSERDWEKIAIERLRD